MMWVSANKADCYKPYIFKADGYVTTPFPVGDYSYTVNEAAKTITMSTTITSKTTTAVEKIGDLLLLCP